MHGFTWSTFPVSSIRKVLLLIQFLIYFEVYFSQAFLTSTGNMVTPEKFLGPGMKWETSDPDYPKSRNELFDSFKTTLKTLCRTFPNLFDDNSSPFH